MARLNGVRIRNFRRKLRDSALEDGRGLREEQVALRLQGLARVRSDPAEGVDLGRFLPGKNAELMKS